MPHADTPHYNRLDRHAQRAFQTPRMTVLLIMGELFHAYKHPKEQEFSMIL